MYGPFLARTDKFKPESMVSIFWDYCMIMFGPFLKQFNGVFIFDEYSGVMFLPNTSYFTPIFGVEKSNCYFLALGPAIDLWSCSNIKRRT